MELCFLCGQQNGRLKPFSSVRTTSSKQPLKKVLQHLANFLKTKLVFKPSACICLICLRELCNYDDLMTKFLTCQRKLTRQLQDMINAENTQISESVSKHLKDDTFKYIDNFKEIENQFNTSSLTSYETIKTETLDGENLEFLENKDFENMDTSDDNLDDMEEVEECLVCGATFKTIDKLANHSLKVHGPKPHICRKCGASRRDEEYLELHMNTHNGKTETDCPFCPKKFTRIQNTIIHMRLHSKKKPFQCEKCGECFTCTLTLMQHGNEHIQHDRLTCNFCQQTYKTRKTLHGHIRAKHPDSRPFFNCSVCSKPFAERFTLNIHMKTHDTTLEKVANQQSLNDAAKEAVVDEIIAEATATEKDIRCVICKKEFVKNFDLNQHLQTEHDVIME